MEKFEMNFLERPEIIKAITLVIDVLNQLPGFDYEYNQSSANELKVYAPDIMSCYKLGILTAECFKKYSVQNDHAPMQPAGR